MRHVFKLSSAVQKANTIELSTKVCKVMPLISIVDALSGQNKFGFILDKGDGQTFLVTFLGIDIWQRLPEI